MDVSIWKVKDYICNVIKNVFSLFLLIENICLILCRYLFNLKKKVKNEAHVEASICEAYIVEKNKNQPHFKVWWWWWSAFEWKLINILQSWTTHTKKWYQEKIFVWNIIQQAYNYVLFNYDELRPIFSKFIYYLNFVINGLFISYNITNSYIF